jgi:hypothetical protein
VLHFGVAQRIAAAIAGGAVVVIALLLNALL